MQEGVQRERLFLKRVSGYHGQNSVKSGMQHTKNLFQGNKSKTPSVVFFFKRSHQKNVTFFLKKK